MASSYSTDLKLELMVTGENAGTWGDKTNTNLNLVQQAIAGVEAIALSDGGDVTLVMSDATISNARNMVLKLTGTLTGASTLSIPDSIEKFYIIDATAVTGPTNLTVKTVSGTGFTLDQAKIYACYTDGTNVTEVSLDTLGGTVAAANISGTIATAQIADNAVTTAKISDNQITTAKISANQVTADEIADDAVGPDQLADTAVTPAEYTSATITVDQQGRITAAASGQAGAGGFEPQLMTGGSASGTLTVNSGSEMLIYATSAGGGGGGAGQNKSTGPGGAGYFGVFQAPYSAPFSQPYTVGAGGTGGPGMIYARAGNAGGGTSIANLFTLNGGNGGNASFNPGPGSPGNPGNPGNLSSGGPLAAYQTGNMNLKLYVADGDGVGGAAGNTGGPPGNPGTPGGRGSLFVFTNTAT